MIAIPKNTINASVLSRIFLQKSKFQILIQLILYSLCCFYALGNANAAVITYTTASLGGTHYRINYVVTAAASPINEFTIFFDRNKASNLSVIASPAAFDSLVVQSDAQLNADGYFDSFSSAGIAAGASVSGFSVGFDLIGAISLGSQSFSIIDPDTFATISSGQTSILSAGPTPPAPPRTNVPEPAPISLMIVAGLALSLVRKGAFSG